MNFFYIEFSIIRFKFGFEEGYVESDPFAVSYQVLFLNEQILGKII